MGAATLKQRLKEAEAERDYYMSLVGAFFTGEVPKQAALQHFILAKWGRRRLEEQKELPALLKTGLE